MRNIIKTTYQKFREFPARIKAMIAMFWVYELIENLNRVFLNTFIFIETQDVMSLIQYNFFYFFGIFLGFVVWGWLMAQWRISIKLNYLKSFILYIVSYVLLVFMPKDLFHFSIFGLINGTALGMFWVGVHSFEMIFTSEKNRDFYSAMVSVGTTILKVFAPMLALFTFFLADNIFKTETFTVLFIVIPIIYLLAMPLAFKLRDFTPEKIPKGEINRLFTDPDLKFTRRFILFGSFDWPVFMIIIPVIALTAMGNIMNIGLIEVIAGLFSAFIVFMTAGHREAENRVKFLWISIGGLILALLMMSLYQVHWIFYVIDIFLFTFFFPQYRVSQHVLDLHAVEKLKSSDPRQGFYPGLIYRDIVITVARMLSILLMYIIHKTFENNDITIFSGIFFIALTYLMAGYKASKMVK